MRNYREEIEVALAGGAPDHVPFTFYDFLFPLGFDTAFLQSQGMAICARRHAYRKIMPNVDEREVTEPDGTIRTIYETPVGTLTALHQPSPIAYATPLGLGGRRPPGRAPLEHPIKTRDDYRVAEFMVRDSHYEPDYDTYLAHQERIGDSGITTASTCYTPLLDIQVMWVGQEQFCYELADNEDAVMDLYDALVQSHQGMYEVLAESPAQYVLYGGNIVPVMLGPHRIRDYVVPCWQALADRLHEKGKKLGSHLDADNRLILDLVAESPLDFIEAFTPPPDCGVSVTEARERWPDKVLWINFPSSVHLATEDRIQQTTRDILAQAGDRRGFLMGVTEDVPTERIEPSVSAILDVIR